MAAREVRSMWQALDGSSKRRLHRIDRTWAATVEAGREPKNPSKEENEREHVQTSLASLLAPSLAATSGRLKRSMPGDPPCLSLSIFFAVSPLSGGARPFTDTETPASAIQQFGCQPRASHEPAMHRGRQPGKKPVALLLLLQDSVLQRQLQGPDRPRFADTPKRVCRFRQYFKACRFCFVRLV